MKEEIIKLRNEGKTYNEIKELLNCSKGTVSYYCSKLENNSDKIEENINIKNQNQKKDISFLLPDDEITKNIISLRKIKKTYKEINKELKVSINIITKVCKKYNLFSKRNYGKLDDEIINKIKNKYEELKSIRKVSKELDVSKDSVRKYANIYYKNKLSNIELKKNRSKDVVNWRIKTKIKLIEYKGGECIKCGYNKSLKVLSFHHRDPKEKDFSISGKSWSFEKLKNEVDKCDLVCSNCHIEIHEEIYKNRSMV